MHITDSLLTEQVNPCTTNIDQLDTEEVLQLINKEDQTVSAAVELVIPQIAAVVDAVIKAFGEGGRLVYIGAGTSGRLGVLDAAECPPTFGVDPGQVVGLIAGGEVALVQAAEGAEDNTTEVVEQLQGINFTNRDVLVGIAASGRTPWVLAGLKYANSLGAMTAALSCTPDSEIGKFSKIVIAPLVGPEVITGSTRLKAGTATKMVLNMLTTTVMVRLGKVYGNLMVDLKPTNEKLLVRAIRIVAEATGVTREEAAEVLEKAGRNAKVAIVMIQGGYDIKEATERLAIANGFINRAINQRKEGKP